MVTKELNTVLIKTMVFEKYSLLLNVEFEFDGPEMDLVENYHELCINNEDKCGKINGQPVQLVKLNSSFVDFGNIYPAFIRTRGCNGLLNQNSLSKQIKTGNNQKMDSWLEKI